MPKFSDDTDEATTIAHNQAVRLKRLRLAVGKSSAAAARASGVEKDSWNRMENGHTRINGLTLGRFGVAYGIPTEYVISGRFVGLPEDLIRLLAQLEREGDPEPVEQEAAPQPAPRPARNVAQPTAAPERRSSEKSTPGKGKRQVAQP